MKTIGIVVVTRAGLLIARRATTWTVDKHLGERSPDCVAVDPRDPTRVYCGTAGAGLFRSDDSGRTWEPVGPGIEHGNITAVAVSHAERAEGFGILCRHRTKCGVSLRHWRRGLGGPRRLARAPFS